MHDAAAEARLDHALVARAVCQQDKRAFEQLVRRHQAKVRAQLRRLMPATPSLADDLAQETFLQAWRKLGQFRGEARFSTWLHRIAFSCYLQEYRRSPLERETVALCGEMNEQAVAAAPIELRLDLERAFRCLSAPEQAVLLHCSQLELSHEEAAYVLEMPLGTVKTHATRGKAKLKQLLADWKGDYERTE